MCSVYLAKEALKEINQRQKYWRICRISMTCCRGVVQRQKINKSEARGTQTLNQVDYCERIGWLSDLD